MKLTKKTTAEPLIDTKAVPTKKVSKIQLSITIIAALIGAVVGVMVALGLSYVIYDKQIIQERDTQLADIGRQKASLTAKRIQTHLDTLTDRVAFYSRQTILRDAITNSDLAAIESTKKTIVSQVPDVVTVNILGVNEISLRQDVFPPINFSELEMLKVAASGIAAIPEATRVDNKWLLNIALPVLLDDGVTSVGVVWVSTGIASLAPLLNKDNAGLGQVELYQNFGARTRVLVAKVGRNDFEDKYTKGIENTQWEVEFKASNELLLLTHIDLSFAYGLIVISLIVCGVGGCVLGFVVGRMLEVKLSRQNMLTQMTMAKSKKSSDGYIDPLYQKQSLFDVDIQKEDEQLLGLEDDEDEVIVVEDEFSLDDDVFDMGESSFDEQESAYPKGVFQAYDIRGIAKEQINKDFAIALGKAVGSEAVERRENTMVVARDARIHSPELTEWLIRGILSTGCGVLNIGTVPTPLMYFTLETMDEVASGVMVTASHNGAAYNGFKVVMGGMSCSADEIQALRRRMIKADFIRGQAEEHHHDIVPAYIDMIFSDVALAGEMSLVIDAGNGVTGNVAPKLFEELGCRVVPLYCDLDGNFPNHEPDPSKEENLQDLIAKVKEEKADLGVALDGDGDRLTVVTPSGKIIWADRLLMLFAKDIISRSPGADVIFDVKSTRHLNSCVASFGGRPIMWKTGHSLMKQKMVETGAMVGAEYSGHIFIKDRWFGFDDGMYAAARLLEVLSLQGDDIDTAFEEFPTSVATPEIRIPVAEEDKFSIITQLREKGDFGEGRLTVLDGVRVDFAYGWGLARASNTGSDITMRFEGDDEDAIHKLKSLFVRELRSIDSSIQVDWNQ